jgi:hypothetical protein
MAMTFLTLLVQLGLPTCPVPVDDAAAAPAKEANSAQAGAALPAFESRDDQGQAWRSSDRLGKRHVLLHQRLH